MDLADLQARSDSYLDSYLSGATSRRPAPADRPPASVGPVQGQLLADLAWCRFATTKQLVTLSGRGIPRVYETLENLRGKKLVSWCRWVNTASNIKDGTGPLPATLIYCLTTKGVERCIFNRALESDMFTLTRSWTGRPYLASEIPHHLGLTDIMVALKIASRRSATHEISWVLPDFVYTDLEGKNRIATIEFPGDKKFEVRPDLVACARAKISGRLYTPYFELERTHRKPRAIFRKFEVYANLFVSDNRRFNDGPPLLLYVTTSRERIKTVMDMVREKEVAPAFRITHIDDLKEDAFGPIWKTATGEQWAIAK